MSLTDEQVSEMTGEEKLKGGKYELTAIRLNGQSGKFVRYDPVKKEEKEIPEKTVYGVMLKHRRMYSLFAKDYSLFSNEHNSWQDEIVLFERRKKADGSMSIKPIDKGVAKELKEKHKLEMTQMIYMLVGEEIVKLRVKGKGLSNLFDFFKTFDRGEHMWQYEVVVGIGDFESPLGKYHAMTFAREQMVEDKDKVIEKIQEVDSAIGKTEKAFEDKRSEKEAEYDERGRSDESNIPIIDEDDEIDVANIPF